MPKPQYHLFINVQERFKEALKADIANKNDTILYAKNFYLFLYNSIQLAAFFAIAMNCTLGFIIRPGSKSMFLMCFVSNAPKADYMMFNYL